MSARRPLRWLLCVGAILSMSGCRKEREVVEPSVQRAPPVQPTISEADEALLASLLSDDPGDFHAQRARVWRLGAARWVSQGPLLSPESPDLQRDLGAPIAAVVIDPEGPRLLLPLAALDPDPMWAALRLIAVLPATDLVTGLRRELHPTPWLTLGAGVGLTPEASEDGHLRVRWSEPACGFGLSLAVDAEDFGPLYEPGPSGPPGDLPLPSGQPVLSLVPETPLFAQANAKQPVLVTDALASGSADRTTGAQQVTRIGDPKRGRQEVELRCRGVVVRAFVSPRRVVESQARFEFVEAAVPARGSCAGPPLDRVRVPRATILYEPTEGGELIGVVAVETDLPARPGAGGWWRSCVPSPWGALTFQFRLGV